MKFTNLRFLNFDQKLFWILREFENPNAVSFIEAEFICNKVNATICFYKFRIHFASHWKKINAQNLLAFGSISFGSIFWGLSGHSLSGQPLLGQHFFGSLPRISFITNGGLIPPLALYHCGEVFTCFSHAPTPSHTCPPPQIRYCGTASPWTTLTQLLDTEALAPREKRQQAFPEMAIILLRHL